ncbi:MULTISPECIES: nucleotidyltransferase domain-containing protein [Dictyoglomus]|jgi:predicted nucleotidyltransferase|uniref:DNA polymerase beta domain protein region n=1 Tax=Dictyoglomus turgidum (strain DSM 6724 / Z-1310) TaxID=515635 RepID=B8DYQ8_DICTD|nr:MULTISPECIES: nucleotidyltransferase domain-containing protein [Dictyoglomus]ACK41440.1 DNA polymerase beta domain protein region [Dictyoglomus turgidum DSM 6724]PNV79774.1 MAG: nucleotidyltransferase domain-containing protein [Dictyoglomus turgidum]HBU31826.1 nucleotidyltransferase domain-containing protein [Dictyoglomus sp.]
MSKAIDHLEESERIILKELKTKLLELLGSNLEAVILFGSKARGDYDNDSDIDVAIIVNYLDRNLKRNILSIVTNLETEYGIPLSTLVISREEFELLKRRERRIALDIEREGIEI